MSINFTGGSDALREFATDKISQIYKLAHRVTQINVIFKVEKPRHHVEINCDIPNLKLLNATAEADDMYAAVGLAVDKIKHQLQKLKGKMQSHQE